MPALLLPQPHSGTPFVPLPQAERSESVYSHTTLTLQTPCMAPMNNSGEQATSTRHQAEEPPPTDHWLDK